MDGIKVDFIEPDLWYLVDAFCDREGIGRINPGFARVVAAIDLQAERIVGILTLQLVAHAEPIVITESHRGNGLWKEMASMMDGYLQTMADEGALQGVYNQPTHPEAQHLCEVMGFQECEFPLYVKKYEPRGGVHIQGGE